MKINKNKTHVLWAIVVLLTLLLTMLFPTSSVLADDTTPPAEPSEVVDAPADEEASPEEVVVPEVETPAIEEPVVEEPAAAEAEVGETMVEEAVATEAEIGETVVEGAAPEEEAGIEVELVLAQVPDSTDLVVLGDDGEVVSLATQAAAEAIASGDPIWCPDGVDPISNAGGCTGSYSSMTALLAALSGANQPSVAGTIWIEKTYDSSTAEPGGTSIINIDGDSISYSTWRNNPLTIQGGWDGPGTNTASGTSLFSGDRFIIQNWLNDVTVRNIVVTNVSSGTGPGLGLDIDGTTANDWSLTVENVAVTNILGNIGIQIDTDETAGFVTINNSMAVNNGSDGFYIEAGGDVTLENITATGNGVDGLAIMSRGLITLVVVEANLNGVDGAEFSNNTSGATQGVDVVSSRFNQNGDDGLRVFSMGDITLINVIAQNNTSDGVELSTLSGGAITICGGGFSGNDIGGGSGSNVDYNVRASGATQLSRGNLTVINPWLPSTGWGAAPCNYPDADGDQVPDQWDTDDDNDGVSDATDNCPFVSNVAQTDTDNDGAGDPCDPTPNGDDDNDGVDNLADNCRFIANVNQADTDNDGTGDPCDNTPNGDNDNDGVDNLADNCVNVANPTQTDTDNDGAGDPCDSTPNGDNDNDGVDNLADNCLNVANPTQTDTDGDGSGDACDATPNGDDDNDGVDNLADNCPSHPNPDQGDTDENSVGDACDDNGSDSPRYPTALLIPVYGLQPVGLSCTSAMSVLQMADFEVSVVSLCGYEALLDKVLEAGLPGKLPNGAQYVSALEATLMQNGNTVAPLPAGMSMTVSYKIPSGMEGKTFAILYWDGGKWVEESVTVENGFVKATSTYTGTYVLVVK